jgi:Ser/Thr protein kinase RdoA (MazF antagonist)
MTPTAKDLEHLYGFEFEPPSALEGSDRAWRVDSRRGPMVLRIHGPERTRAHDGEMAVLRRCAEAGYAAPRVVPTPGGGDRFDWDDGEGYLTTWIEGVDPEANVEDARRLGMATGRLHAVPTEGFGIPATSFSVVGARREFRALDVDPAVRAWEGYEEIRDPLLATWAALSDLDTAPRAIVHTDVHRGNAVRTPDGEMVLIDWDDAGLGPAVQDVGYVLVHSAVRPDGECLPEMALAFLDGYEQARALSDVERRLLPDAMVFGALSYVLAPWEDRVVAANWRRVRTVLDQPERIGAMISA